MQLLDLPYNEGVFAGCINNVKEGTEAGAVLERAIVDFCSSRTSEEAERAFVEAGLPCSRILSHMEMLDNPHYLARESLTKWPRVDGGELTGQNVTPKLAKTQAVSGGDALCPEWTMRISSASSAIPLRRSPRCTRTASSKTDNERRKNTWISA